MASMYQGDYAGWAFKQGSLVRNWKKRYMVLSGRQLTYYDTANITPAVRAKGSFQVITAELSTEIQNGLLVHGRGGRVLKLYTSSADQTSALYNAILDATTAAGSSAMERRSSMGNFQKSSSVLSSSDDAELIDRLDSLPLEDSLVQHEGWLMKEGMRVKTWKRRFFMLRGNALSYFDSQGTGAAAKGYGHVQRIEVAAARPRGLDIQFDSGRMLYVTAETDQDLQDWLIKLSEGIESAQAEDQNIRESVAARNTFRASLPASLQGTRPPPQRHSVPYKADRRRSPTSSFTSSTMSQSRTTNVIESDSDEFLSSDDRSLSRSPSDSGSGSESDGDWI